MPCKCLGFLIVVVVTVGCQSATAPTPLTVSSTESTSVALTPGPGASTNGGGHFLLLDTIDAKFAFTANAGGAAGPTGRFHQSFVFQGELVEFYGRVICVSVDPTNRRAWVGGIVTENNSTHSAFTAARHQPGRDIWFRVLDGGEGARAEPDRTTTMGFEGDAGFITSLAYCEGQPWPDANARTWPVTEGNIQVRP
jgi:hypothetical protein